MTDTHADSIAPNDLEALTLRKDAEISALHRQLAAERLRADQGWERYESANKDRNQLRAAMADRAAQEHRDGLAGTQTKIALPIEIRNWEGSDQLFDANGEPLWIQAPNAPYRVALDEIVRVVNSSAQPKQR